MIKDHLERFAECLNVSTKGLVQSLLGEVCGVGGGEDHVIMVMMLVVMVIVHLRANMVPIELRVRNSSGRAWHSDLPWWSVEP